MHEIRIEEKILEAYPAFRRGIVVASNIKNDGHSKALEGMLNQAVEGAGKHPIDIKTDPRTEVWMQAHRQFGSNPNKFPPAHCSLLKRVQKAGTRIPFINKVVAIMNYNSITAVTPVGGDDLERAGLCLELRYANGDERFTPLGQPEITEHPGPGEIIYVVAETGEVMCRRWNWRNGHNTLISEETHTIVMNIDCLGADSEEKAVKIRDQVAGMLVDFCGAAVTTTMLSPSHMSYRFTP